MNVLSNVTKLVTQLQRTTVKNGPAIATAVGVSGLIATSFLMIGATKKATVSLENAEQDKLRAAKESGIDYVKDPILTPEDKFKAVWRYYTPPVLLGAASVLCIVGAGKAAMSRNAAIATAYSVAQTSFDEYKDKVVETLGDKKESQIREEIDKDHLRANPDTAMDVIATSDGNDLFYDSLSGRYFYSSAAKIDAAITKLNADLLADEYASLNEFYYYIKIPQIIPLGESLGWNISWLSSRKDMLQAKYDTQFSDSMKPCGVLSFNITPKWDFEALF